MKFKIRRDKDYRIKNARIRNRYRNMVPAMTVTVTDNQTGEIREGKMKITEEFFADCTPFIKFYRPNILTKLSIKGVRTLIYFMEKVNRWGVVEINWTEFKAFLNIKTYQEGYPGLKEMVDMSIAKKVDGKRSLFQVYPECFSKAIRGDDNKRRNERFVKIYQPRAILQLGKIGLKTFAYVCDRMNYEGVIEFKPDDYKAYVGAKQNMSAWRGKQELMAADMIRDLHDIVAMESPCKPGTYFRVNPNIFMRGERSNAGYLLDDA